MLGKISNSLEELDILHCSYKWVPNSNQIRPSRNLLLDKQQTIRFIEYQWASMGDYIRHKVFGLPYQLNDWGKKVVRENPTWSVFQPSHWPYELDEGEHYIMWYPVREKIVSDYQIDIDIQNAIYKIFGDRYDYAWYINPKMNVPEYFHLQVFLKRY